MAKIVEYILEFMQGMFLKGSVSQFYSTSPTLQRGARKKQSQNIKCIQNSLRGNSNINLQNKHAFYISIS